MQTKWLTCHHSLTGLFNSLNSKWLSSWWATGKDVHGIPSSKSVCFWADYGTPAFAGWAYSSAFLGTWENHTGWTNFLKFLQVFSLQVVMWLIKNTRIDYICIIQNIQKYFEDFNAPYLSENLGGPKICKGYLDKFRCK